MVRKIGGCLARFLGGLILCWAVTTPAWSETEYRFGVVPQFDQRKLFAIWTPILESLAARTGIRLKLVVTLSVAEFERDLAQGAFDFVYANPYHILREASREGYIPLVRDELPLRGIVVVAKDSPFRAPADLNGQSLAVPSMNALGASLMVRVDLARLFHTHVTPVNVKTHSSVYLNVANGLLPAGGGVEKTLSEQSQDIRDLLRVLYVTREMPSHPISAHPRVTKAMQEKVRDALLAMAATPDGQALLAKIPMPKLVRTSLKDYQAMSGWGLESYWTP